jgi:hypothetical protein
MTNKNYNLPEYFPLSPLETPEAKLFNELMRICKDWQPFGGTLRDLFLGKVPTDIDLVVNCVSGISRVQYKICKELKKQGFNFEVVDIVSYTHHKIIKDRMLHESAERDHPELEGLADFHEQYAEMRAGEPSGLGLSLDEYERAYKEGRLTTIKANMLMNLFDMYPHLYGSTKERQEMGATKESMLRSSFYDLISETPREIADTLSLCKYDVLLSETKIYDDIRQKVEKELIGSCAVRRIIVKDNPELPILTFPDDGFFIDIVCHARNHYNFRILPPIWCFDYRCNTLIYRFDELQSMDKNFPVEDIIKQIQDKRAVKIGIVHEHRREKMISKGFIIEK